MPRETIQSVTDPYRVKVGWSHDRGVQVGVEGEGERSLFWLLLGPYAEELGAILRTELDGANTGSPRWKFDSQIAETTLNALDTASHGGFRGVWSDLDRQGCNDLIRILRRARDSAFGRDE